MRSHRYRNRTHVLPRIDRNGPEGGMLPPTQAQVDLTQALADRLRVQDGREPVPPVEVTADE